jgi:hypothetical protein
MIEPRGRPNGKLAGPGSDAFSKEMDHLTQSAGNLAFLHAFHLNTRASITTIIFARSIDRSY